MNDTHTIRGRPHLKIREMDMRRSLTVLVVKCPQCQGDSQLIVPTGGLGTWLDGALIQDALPMLDKTQREQLISGTCQPCWEKMWAEEEDEDLAGFPVPDDREDFHADG